MTFWSRIARRVAMTGVLCLLILPAATWASSTCFPGFVCVDNQGGTAVGGATGLVLNGSGGSVQSTVVGINGLATTGTLSLTTGALNGGTFGTGICAGPPCTVGTFGTGALTINVDNFNGFSGALFTGTFGDPTNGLQWVYTGTIGTGANKAFQYELIGPVSGTWENGGTVSGQTAQLFFTSKTAYKGGTITLTTGTTAILTPEPTSIGLLGTGLLTMGVLIRRKVKKDLISRP